MKKKGKESHFARVFPLSNVMTMVFHDDKGDTMARLLSFK